jgi:hypothetical protein
MGDSETPHRHKPQKCWGFRGFPKRHKNRVWRFGNRKKLRIRAACGGVAFRNPPSGDDERKASDGAHGDAFARGGEGRGGDVDDAFEGDVPEGDGAADPWETDL